MVAKLLIEAEALSGQMYRNNRYFNPIQDADGNWIVSIVESRYLNDEDFELIEYNPIIPDEFLSK